MAEFATRCKKNFFSSPKHGGALKQEGRHSSAREYAVVVSRFEERAERQCEKLTKIKSQVRRVEMRVKKKGIGSLLKKGCFPNKNTMYGTVQHLTIRAGSNCEVSGNLNYMQKTFEIVLF